VIADTDVVVVGAGIAGAAAALGCAQPGLKVVLLGPAPAPVQASAAAPPEAPFDARIYALAPATITLLDRLKVWPQVDLRRMQAVTRMRVFGDAGQELSFDAYGAAVERLATIGEESELARVLRTACAYTPGLQRIEAGFAGMSIEAGCARVHLDDGRELAARLLIAADGANSAVRAAAGINADEKRYEQTAVVTNFRTDAPHHGVAWQWFTAEGVVALLPLAEAVAGPALSLVWSAPDELARRLLADSPEGLAQRVMTRIGVAPGRLAPLGPSRGFPLRRISVDRLVVPRVALVGDAAHVVHPLAGQGLNLGLADVSELLDVLASRESYRDIGDLVLLRRYARKRAEAIDLMRWTTDGLARLFSIDDPLVRRVRNAGLALVNAAGPIKRALIRQALG
jgi:ubiquinone biosynthesis UbiH/UbiF/VisC/COQ6 family hydroxylase